VALRNQLEVRLLELAKLHAEELLVEQAKP
jgi:hypothetical protein